MLGHTFYHGTIRKYVILFGTLFNELYINRPDPTHNRTLTYKVPIAYAPRDKMLARLTADPDLRRQPAIVLPRMSFELVNTTYAAERKLTTITRNVAINTENPDQLKYGYAPVPYDFDFELNVYVKNTDDGTRIIEQILPFFTPEWTPSVNLIPELDIVQDIPIVLKSVRSEDTYEGSFEERRALTWILEFTMKGYIYGPTRKGEIIKLANTNFFDTSAFDDIDTAVGSSNADVIANFTIIPGFANGAAVAGNPSTATGTSTLSGDGVASVTITSKGYNYITANVTFSAPPTAQTATATSTISSNVVVGLGISTYGSAYTSAPAVTIAPPSAAAEAATGTVTVESSTITGVVVSSGGRYYLANGVATTTAEVNVGGSFGFATANSVAVVANGVVTSIGTPDFGSANIVSATVVVTNPTGNSSNFQATATSTVTGGQVTLLSITDGGLFYSSAPAVTIAAPPAAVTATGTVTVAANVVQEVVITNTGTGYSTAPTVTISDPVQSANSSLIQGNTSYGYIITRS